MVWYSLLCVPSLLPGMNQLALLLLCLLGIVSPLALFWTMLTCASQLLPSLQAFCQLCVSVCHLFVVVCESSAFVRLCPVCSSECPCAPRQRLRLLVYAPYCRASFMLICMPPCLSSSPRTLACASITFFLHRALCVTAYPRFVRPLCSSYAVLRVSTSILTTYAVLRVPRLRRCTRAGC